MYNLGRVYGVWNTPKQSREHCGAFLRDDAGEVVEITAANKDEAQRLARFVYGSPGVTFLRFAE